MFTGLVQGQGRIESARAGGGQTRFMIRPQFELTDYVLGESIAVNGVCLSVETFSGGAFSVYASAETMRRTGLGTLKAGDLVNLERALALGDRLGGHLVSGHVDCLAEVAEVTPVGESRRYVLNFPEEMGVYVVEKGSVALDGISLTVNDCGATWLSVNIIPETQRVTTISRWQPGYRANMEADIIGKYVARMVGPFAARASGGAGGSAKKSGGGLTEAFLRDHGF